MMGDIIEIQLREIALKQLTTLAIFAGVGLLMWRLK